MSAAAIVQLDAVHKHYPMPKRWFARAPEAVRAVDGVTLRVGAGETLGLVGESGSGKSTLGRLAIRLIAPTSGVVRFEGTDLASLDASSLRALRRRMQVVFQDPRASLHPRRTIAAAFAEVLAVHGLASSASAARERTGELLRRVGLSPDLMERYPHEFSGGQRQRLVIARALAVEPRFLVLDEPVSALDVSVQAQVANLLKDLQDELGLSYLFVSHDLGVVRWMSHRVAVMYLGRIVEEASSESLFETAAHPYTKALIASVHRSNERVHLALARAADEPKPTGERASGCAFHPRCPIARPGLCDRIEPPLERKGEGHVVACHLASESADPAGPSTESARS